MNKPDDFRDPNIGKYHCGKWYSYYALAKEKMLDETDVAVELFMALHDDLHAVGSKGWLINATAIAMQQEEKLLEMAETIWEDDQ